MVVRLVVEEVEAIVGVEDDDDDDDTKVDDEDGDIEIVNVSHRYSYPSLPYSHPSQHSSLHSHTHQSYSSYSSPKYHSHHLSPHTVADAETKKVQQEHSHSKDIVDVAKSKVKESDDL